VLKSERFRPHEHVSIDKPDGFAGRGIVVMPDVTAHVDTVTIPTYELGSDDINPIVDRRLNPYPYTQQNHKTGVRVEKAYEAVVVENEYIRLIVVPSLGGRLYSAVDKRTGREFLYRNPVIRPRMIGTRGAWFSGGMEFNFPISHSPNTMDRVNYQIRHDEDGSASVTIGNIERISNMNWKVELKLYPGRTYFEQKVSLYNPVPRESRFYFWTNTAVEYDKSVKLIYPFDWCINFDSQYVKWPYYKEMDCRYPREIPYAYETFGKLMTHDFFGAYNVDQNHGIVHYADRKKVKGAKFFIWGNDSNAEAWNRCLTEGDSQYIEIQSGPFESQMVYKFLKPHQELVWNEYWYPVSGMDGGFKYASKELAVNFERSAGGVSFCFSATEALPDCELIFTVNGTVQQRKADFSPLKLSVIEFEVENSFQLHEIKLDVYCGDRHIAAIGERNEFTEEYPDTDIFEDSRVTMMNQDPDKTLKHAQWRESLGLTAEAFELYRSNLLVYPTCNVTLNRLGNLYLKSMQYERAADCLRKVLAYDNRNSQARFYLAVTEKEKGNSQRARRLFMDIAADAEYYRPSVIELIKLDLLFGYDQEARMLCEQLGEADAYTRFLVSICRRKDMRTHNHGQADNWTPDEYGLAECYLKERSNEAKESFVGFTGGDAAVIVAVALEYVELGLRDDAADLLKLIRKPGLMAQLVLASCLTDEKERMTEMLTVLQQQSLDYVFPQDPRIMRLLMELESYDDTGRADYLLGMFLYASGDRETGLARYRSAYDKGLRYTSLLHGLGYIHLHWLQDPRTAEKYFSEDVVVNGTSNTETLVWLDKVFAAVGDPHKRAALVPLMEQAVNRALVLERLVDIYLQTGQEDKAFHILDHEEFENWEGRETSGASYRNAILHMVRKELEKEDFDRAHYWINRADLYPAGLHYGPHAGTPFSDIQYFKGLVLAGLGQEHAALEHFREGYRELSREDIIKSEKSRSYSMLCLEQLNKRESLG
jgi:tetratricopeptide (TPR) repeat protein